MCAFNKYEFKSERDKSKFRKFNMSIKAFSNMKMYYTYICNVY